MTISIAELKKRRKGFPFSLAEEVASPNTMETNVMPTK